MNTGFLLISAFPHFSAFPPGRFRSWSFCVVVFEWMAMVSICFFIYYLLHLYLSRVYQSLVCYCTKGIDFFSWK